MRGISNSSGLVAEIHTSAFRLEDTYIVVVEIGEVSLFLNSHKYEIFYIRFDTLHTLSRLKYFKPQNSRVLIVSFID